jgi:predicted esterase
LIAHGSRDPVIGIEFAERARQLLEEGGLAVSYYESELGHQIEPAHLVAARSWLGETIPSR